VSWWTIKGIIKKAGYSYRRVKKSLKSNRDMIMFHFFAQEIKQLRTLTEVELWFYDESSFHLNPTVVYAWQGKGSDVTLPAQRGNLLTVAGFMKTDNSFEGYYQQGSMDQDLFIAYIEDFITKRVKSKTIVIMDRASFHTCAKVKQKMQDWQKQHLYIQLLPAYCSELNLIEHLWRVIKHEWLPLSAYQSALSLTQQVLEILQNIGSKYRITFT
jgi:transposase